MSGYVATKNLKEHTLKGWVDELLHDRVEAVRTKVRYSESAFVRLAVEQLCNRIDREGYRVLVED